MPLLKKTILPLVLMLTMHVCAFCIPALPQQAILTQPDGTTIVATFVGDEHCHFYVDEDGDMLIKDINGYYRKATIEERNNKFIHWNKRLKARNEIRRSKARNNRLLAKSRSGINSTFRGKKKGLVILAQFTDLKMKIASPQAEFDAQFNQKGYNKNNHIGSVRDYFYDQSYGMLDIEFDVIGPVTVSKNYAYYGQNDNVGDDMHPWTMVKEACKLIDSQVNFADYDWNGDGEVDQVYVIYAGYGENAQGANENTIWPHEFDLESAHLYDKSIDKFKLDGTWINTYAVSCELNGAAGKVMNAIGTACHEFTHCLGLPDWYDTSYSGGFGMSYWDLMDSGSYSGPNGRGEVPSGLCAYDRWYAGWLEPIELNSPCDIKDMPCLGDKPMAYVIYNNGNRNEFFILENRQADRWFKYVKSYKDMHGLLVYHVDYDEDAWWEDTPNCDGDHQRMSLIPADNGYGSYNTFFGTYNPTESQLRGDLFPGTKSVTELTNTSHDKKGGKLFNKNTDGSYYMNKPVTNITEYNGLISFKFMGGQAAAIASAQNDDKHSETEYYTLSGFRVTNPTRGNIYLIRRGGSWEKVKK